jgi:hypothetical protein
MNQPEKEIIEKLGVSEEALGRVQQAHPKAVTELLNPEHPRANVVGIGVGKKHTDGRPTDEAALLVLVTQKVGEDLLNKEDIVPSHIEGIRTDVLAVGELIADVMRPPEAPADGRGRIQRVIDLPEAVPAAPAPGIELLARHVRPAEGGYSVGHVSITAGTIATCVYDILPGGTTNPPMPGVGIPSHFYILSNNHVLAASNAGRRGDAILQPGPADGGTYPADLIARLDRFVPITFDPPVPRAKHANIVDCAVAEGNFADLDREIEWTGPARGWRRRADVVKMVGHPVKKTGRTTNISFGRITAVNATVDVNYGNGRVARFLDQIVTTAMSAGGDSGSLLLTPDNVAVGLLFAGSPIATIFNQIEHVRSLLRVEVAEQIL